MNKLTKIEFRNAMARVCSPVNIVTTNGSAGRGGFTATAMCSVTDDPPTLLVCMNGKSSQMAMFKANGVFCVNVLPSDQAELAANFAGAIANMDDRYATAIWTEFARNLPALNNALVSFACEIVNINRVGTHDIIVGQVIDILQRGEGEPLLYFNRKYANLPVKE